MLSSPFASLCLSLYETRSFSGEAVVRGDEIYARPRTPAAPVELVAGAGKALGEIGHHALIAFPESADGIAEAVVPFRPARRKAAHLIAARTAIPRLGNQTHAREHRILPATVEKAAAFVETMRLAAENRGEIEAETVHFHFAYPVAQAVGHHLQHARMRQVQRIAGTGVVDVIARFFRHQTVVRSVVDALERDRRAAFVAFGGVVVHDVEDHFEIGVMEAVDHRLEFFQRCIRAREKARVSRKEANRVVAPVVRQTFVEQITVVDEHVDGQQFDGGDAQPLDVIDHRLLAEAGERAAQIFRHGGMALRETAHMRLVDNHAFPRQRIALGVAPREIGVHHLALRHEGGAVALVEGKVAVFVIERVAEDFRPPLQIANMRLGVRVEQQFVRIEAMAFLGCIRAMHAVAIDRTGLQIRHEDMPDLIGIFGKFDALNFLLAR